MPPLCWEVATFSQNSPNISTGVPTVRCVLTVYLQPCICLVGIVLNLLCLGIFCKFQCCRRSRKSVVASPLVPYLTALTTFDATQLLFSIPTLSFSSAIRHQISIHQHSDALIHNTVYLAIFLHPIMLSSNYASTWLITVICVQRYFAVCHPMLNRTLNILHKGNKIILAIIFLAFGLNFIRWFEYTLVFLENRVYLMPTQLKQDVHYNLIYEGFVYSLTMYVVPFLTLVVLSFRIIRVIRRAEGSRSQLTHHEKRENRSTRMILTVVGIFIACNTLSMIIRWWAYIDSSIEAETTLPDHPALLIHDLSNVLMNVNSAVNPLIYFLRSRKFKDLFSSSGKRSDVTRHNTVPGSAYNSGAEVDGRQQLLPLTVVNKVTYQTTLPGRTSISDNSIISDSSTI